MCSRVTIYNTWGYTCLASTASEDDIIGMFALKTRLSAEINKEQSRFRTSLEKGLPHQVLPIYPSFSSLHFFPNGGPESFSPLQNSYERQFNHSHCGTFIYYNFLLFIVSIVTLHFFWLVRHQFLPLDYYVCECPLHSQSNFFDEEFTGHSHICPRVHSKVYLYTWTGHFTVDEIISQRSILGKK